MHTEKTHNAARRARSHALGALLLLVVTTGAFGAPVLDGSEPPSPSPSFEVRTPLAPDTIVDRLDSRANLVAPIMPGVFDPSGLQQTLQHDRFLDALSAHTDSSEYVDFTGATPFAQSVRYVEDFEDASVERREWDGLRTRAFDGMSRVAGPFRNSEASLHIDTQVDQLYSMRFDLALIAPRLGSSSASDTLVIEIDGEPVLQRRMSEYTKIARDLRTDPSDPLIAPKIQLFFRAGHRITTITFRCEETGDKGGEVWGLDTMVIDVVEDNPASFRDLGFSPYSTGAGGGAGGGGGGFRSRPPGGASSSSNRDGGGNDFDPSDFRLPDESIFPPDDTPTPAPDQPPTERTPPDTRRPNPPGDPPPPTDPPPPPPEVPAPGTGLVFGLGALAMSGRRRRD